MNSNQLVTKMEAAQALGVSLSTFERSRTRWGICPAPTLLKRPVLYKRGDIEALKRAVNGGCIVEIAMAPESPKKIGIMSLPEIKRAAKRKGGRK